MSTTFKTSVKNFLKPQPKQLRSFSGGITPFSGILTLISKRRHIFKVWISRRDYRFRKNCKFTRPLRLTYRYKSLLFGLGFIKDSRDSFLGYYLNHFQGGTNVIKNLYASRYNIQMHDRLVFIKKRRGVNRAGKGLAERAYSRRQLRWRKRYVFTRFHKLVAANELGRSNASKLGKVNFVEGFVEITFFHNLNKTRLLNLRGKKVTTFLSKFKRVWGGVYSCNLMLVYYFLSFYMLKASYKNGACQDRVVNPEFSAREKNSLITFISVSPLDLNFYIYFIKLHLVIWYKELVKVKFLKQQRKGNHFIFLSLSNPEKPGKKYKTNNLLRFLGGKINTSLRSMLYSELKKLRGFKNLYDFLERLFGYFGFAYPALDPTPTTPTNFVWKIGVKVKVKTKTGTKTFRKFKAVITTRSLTSGILRLSCKKFFVKLRNFTLTTKLVKFIGKFFGRFIKPVRRMKSLYLRMREVITKILRKKTTKLVTLSLWLIGFTFRGFKRRLFGVRMMEWGSPKPPIPYIYLTSKSTFRPSVNYLKFPFWFKRSHSNAGYKSIGNSKRIEIFSNFYGFNHNFLTLNFFKSLLIQKRINEFNLYGVASLYRGKIQRVYSSFKQVTSSKRILYLHLAGYHYWLFIQLRVDKGFYRVFLRPYNVWIFFLNYSLKYYLLAKLHFFFVHYLFYILSEKFLQIAFILRIKNFELAYDIIKEKDQSRYHIGIRPDLFITTFNRRVKKGLLWKKFFGI